ncbi:hypothetical protein P280DRAFT_466637 [Massarina eburnea CBS 473.64]|uniref:SAP domain-containing protein n=1 Tax=Massarina eburnea CBS 473.64 TaxID=1395130 RepID=A0A6A6S850_9PLEO|nr:hypothetical protein P280DRAFT_466637 [Massarina eburnea CBS 473.64]
MPRTKRPLSTTDPNATSRSKVPKLKDERQSENPVKQEPKQEANEKPTVNQREPHPAMASPATSRIRKHIKAHTDHPIDVSIAERFENKSYMMRHIETYSDLQIAELKELLKERKLPVSGKKPDLVSRIEKYDEQHPSGAKKVGDEYKEALARQPVHIGAKPSEMGPKREDSTTTMQRHGPRGPPVYDDLGFELDYEKCTRLAVSKSAMVNSMERRLAMGERETEIKARIMGVPAFDGNRSVFTEDLWNDRVSRDLNIPYHKVTAATFEEWQRQGFRVEPGELDADKITELEMERLEFLMSGAGLRK